MRIESRIDLLAATGSILKRTMNTESFDDLLFQVRNQNPWFTESNVLLALNHITDELLDKDKITDWISRYSVKPNSKSIAIIMAGNLPLVGFHDLIAVFVAGFNAQIKLSSKDKVLLKNILSIMKELEPKIDDYISVKEQLKGFDAVLATGSDNSKRYFEKYFGHVPNIIRGNRNSVAILNGSESKDELELLGNDMYQYFGMGCRSVNNLLITEEVNMERVISHFENWNHLQNHHKYFNNYEYYKSIFLVNSEPHLDNGFSLFRPNYDGLISPVSVINYRVFANRSAIYDYLETQSKRIQCVVGDDMVNQHNLPFGKTQIPGLMDYADNADVVQFLVNIR